MAGEDNEILEGLSGLESPASRTVTTREPLVVNDMIENRAMEGWRQRALDHGYQAMMALPLVYEDALYGCLNVYAQQSGVFGDLEQTVLSELADTIAYAINGAESRKALLGQELTALEFRVTETNVGFVELARELGATDVVSARGQEAVEEARAITDGGANHVLECVGAASALETAAQVVRPGGTVGYVGVPHVDRADFIQPLFYSNASFTGGPAPVRNYAEDLLADVLQGTLDPSPIFTKTVDLEAIADGYRAMDEREAIKVLVEV